MAASFLCCPPHDGSMPLMSMFALPEHTLRTASCVVVRCALVSVIKLRGNVRMVGGQ